MQKKVLFILFFLINQQSQAQKYSLRFYGTWLNDGGRIKIPLDKPNRVIDVGAVDFTIEFWMRTSQKPAEGFPNTGVLREGSHNSSISAGTISGNFIFDRDIFATGDYGKYWISMGRLDKDSAHPDYLRIGFGIDKGGNGYTIVGKTNVADDEWHHIACTREMATGKISVFVDGKLENSYIAEKGDISYRDNRKLTPIKPLFNWFRHKKWVNEPFLVIGAEKHSYDQYEGSSFPRFPPYNGWLDEIRFSNIVRYTSDFIRPISPFTDDEQTIAIYHFEEGSGLTVSDDRNNKKIKGKLFVSGYPRGPVWDPETPFK